ncbi:MAG: hypothetical protein ABJA82_10745, partial [Myxococcales bacterium]
QAPSARKINPAISAAVEMVLFQALAKDRNDRFQTMHEFREALLDPEGYLAGAPSVGVPTELTGVTRLAAPMARRDMTFDSTVDFGSHPGGGGGVVGRPAIGPSTFRHGVGQLFSGGQGQEEVPTLAPKSGQKVVLTIMGGVALAGLAIVMAGRSKPEPRRLTLGTTPAMGQPTIVKTPRNVVRINFSSDPDGAIVTRADDGAPLGRTPLSLEVPYSDETVQFVLRKPGYEDKVMLIVPNLPAPIFATLRPLDKVPLAGGPGAGWRRSSGGKDPRRQGTAPPPGPPTPNDSTNANPKKPRSTAVDEDEVLEPDFK